MNRFVPIHPLHLFASSKESTYFPPPPLYCGGCGGDGEGGGGSPLGVLNRFALLALEIASGCIRGAAPPPPPRQHYLKTDKKASTKERS